jgi:hypothetical protein
MLKWVLRSDAGYLTPSAYPSAAHASSAEGARRRVLTVGTMLTPATAIRPQAAAKVAGLLSVARLAQ